MPYPRLARAAVARRLSAEPSPEALAPGEALGLRRACFVSLKTKSGALRGCMGTIRPVHENLAAEIAANALAAAFRDPRFPPLTARELAATLFSVDILSEPEPVSSLEELDPARWGVIVSQGGRRGLLLPDLPGVDSVERQLSIAAAKAGLADFKNAVLERFSVERHPERP